MVRRITSLGSQLTFAQIQLRLQAAVMSVELSSRFDELLKNSKDWTSSLSLPLYFGRSAETDAVVQQVTGRSAGRVVILGEPGTGKTTLSVAVLHHEAVVRHYGGSRYFIACDAAKGRTGSCLSLIAHAFGISATDARVARAKLQDKIGADPVLIVLDNFESSWEYGCDRGDAEDVLQFLAGISGLSVILTLRGSERPRGVKWTRPFLPPLAPLSDAAAMQTSLSISDSPPEFESATRTLLGELENIPLAVVLLANLAQSEAPTSLLQRWDELKTSMLVRGDGQTRLTSLDLSIALSIHCPRMDSVPTATTLLSVLSLLPHGAAREDIHAWNVYESPHSQALSALLQTSLATRSGDQRVRVLAPIRSFMLLHHPPPDPICAPVYRHYFGLTDIWDPFKSFNTAALMLIEPEILNIESLLHHWFTGSRVEPGVVIRAVTALCVLYGQTGLGTGPIFIPSALALARDNHLDGLRAALLSVHAVLARRAAVPGDPESLFREAREIHTRLGNVNGEVDCSLSLMRFLSSKDAVPEGRRLFNLAESRGDSLLIAHSAMSLAQAYERDGKLQEAIEQHGLAISLFLDNDAEYHVALAKGRIASNYLMTGNSTKCVLLYEEALRSYQQLRDANGMLIMHIQLSHVFLLRARPIQAKEHAEQAFSMQQAQGFRDYQLCILRLAEANAMAGSHDDATATMTRLEKILSSVKPTIAGQCEIWNTRGDLALLRGDFPDARIFLSHNHVSIHRGTLTGMVLDEVLSSDALRMVVLGELECAEGNHSDALILAVASTVVCYRAGEGTTVLRGLALLAEAIDEDAAERIVLAILLPLRQLQHAVGEAIVSFRLATIALSRDKATLATKWTQRARSILEGWVPWVGVDGDTGYERTQTMSMLGDLKAER
ncbi:hypothetical protein AURDEDRAFT_139620 [Auricularia subglabra TFB-10046 SS5]|nr:hypothetical protein AURDEDRAFT_139620 [Auricularia subglabra TFB-10046 SS5]